MTPKNDAKYEEKLICCFKNDKNLVNFDLSSQNSQNFHFEFDLKKYRGVTFHDTEKWCKIWGKTELWFGKWHEEFDKFSPEHLKVSKLGLWWDAFLQSRKCMSLKFTEEFCVMAMKNDAKFKEELTCHFKIDKRNLMKFDPSTQKSKKIAL